MSSTKSGKPLDAGAAQTSREAIPDALDLTDHFLIAMPNMADPNFSGTVVYIVEHAAKGAMGIVVNRPTELSMVDLLERIDLSVPNESLKQRLSDQRVLLGGPVQNDRGFVVHRPSGAWSSSIRINDQVALTSSKDVLESVAKGTGPDEVVLVLGYAGWGAGQLEAEISQNAWLTVPADTTVLFESKPEDRQSLAFGLLGIDPLLMSSVAGHA
jgi:putative transcriptional regulator